MKLILTKDVPDLGTKGEVVNVSDGYGRNYLVPKAYAVKATEGALRQAEAMRTAHEETVLRERADADALVSLHDADGTFRLSVDESDLPDLNAETADLELWLIQPDADGNPADLVSLGLIDPTDPGTFDVPEGFDPDVFFVVDISVEPRDGNAAHSGRSILRGALTKA